MRQKKIKKLRKAMKEANGFSLPVKADYRISKVTKIKAYFTDKKTGEKVGPIKTERQCIINVAKLPYQRLKRDFKKK